MFNHELYASTLARAVDTMRHKDNIEAQKGALRAIVALAAAGSATVRCYDNQLSIDDVQIDNGVPYAGVLSARMDAHQIAEIAIGRGAEPAELLALLRGLAEGPYGTAPVKQRLREVKSTRIMVLLADDTAGEKPRDRRSISDAFAQPPGVEQSPGRKSRSSDDAQDALAAWDALHNTGTANPMMKEIDLGFSTEIPIQEAKTVPDAPMRAAAEPEPVAEIPVDPATPLGQALLQLARHPYDGAVLDRLTELAEQVHKALANDDVQPVLKALGMVAGLEPGAPDGTPKNSYRITLRRILTRETLVQVAPYVVNPALAEPAAATLAMSPNEATDVLLGLLASAGSIKERRAYMVALQRMPQGRDQIPVMLGHAQWFVARNMAELAGEMRLLEAIPGLAKLLKHADNRVGRAAVIALVKIGTEQAYEPLRQVLKEGPNELRAVLASLIGSAQGKSFQAPLIVRLDAEEDPESIREICMALARIGSPETLAALNRAAKSGTLFSRRGKILRESAEEALKKVVKK